MISSKINPLDKAYGWFLPHLGVAAAIAVFVCISFFAGFWSGERHVKHNAQFFRAKYSCTEHRCLPNPTAHALVAYKPVATTRTGTINVSLYPAVGDQGPQGACAAWATAWNASYLWRYTHPGSYLRFSPRQMYSHYSVTYSGGFDGGSWPDQDAEISSTTGLLQFKADPLPPFVIDNPEMPYYDSWGHISTVDAAKHRFHISFTALSGFAMGGGPGLSQAIMQAIDNGNPVLIGFPVYPEYDNATMQPTILPPTSGEQSRGDHENVVLAFDKNHLFPDGHRGLAFLVQNQWTRAWGINGRAWMSDAFVQKYVWGVEVMHISASAPKAGSPPPFFPNRSNGHHAPGVTTTTARTRTGLWYVHGVVTHDTHVDVSGLMNYFGDKYNVPPIGLAATAGIESSVNQYADRCCIPGDTSYGIVQETTGTACSYAGVCTNEGARSYLNNLYNAIQLEARYYRDAEDYHGGRIPFPNLYITYNAGPGYSDSFYFNPSGIAADHYYRVFLPWWNFAAVQWSGPPPPPPKFPAKTWGWYTWKHHLKSVSYKDGKRLAHGADLWWRYGPKRAGSVVSRERYYRVPHGRGYLTQRFQTHRLYWWPGTDWWKMIVVRPIR